MQDPKINENKNPSFHIPFFSIIIASYNRANLINRAVNSLISQTEKDWEAIIVDDGSNDDSYSVIQPLLEKDSRIKYIRKEHGGEVSTKNKGICSAAGKFITFLDSDDEYAPEHLASRKKMLLENPDVKLLSGGVRIIGNQFVPDRFNQERMIHLSECVIGGTFFIERNILSQVNGFKEIYLGADADLFDRIKNTGAKMMKTDNPTYIYHHETEDSITNVLFRDINYL
jgi:glycosyltransferase involved in cell wall biosynthesis